MHARSVPLAPLLSSPLIFSACSYNKHFCIYSDTLEMLVESCILRNGKTVLWLFTYELESIYKSTNLEDLGCVIQQYEQTRYNAYSLEDLETWVSQVSHLHDIL